MILRRWGGCIPGRAIYNNCVMFIADVKRVSAKKTLNKSDLEIMKKAAVVAAVSSNHSWKTYKFLHDYCDFDKESMIAESEVAFTKAWKNITEADVEEVVNGECNQHSLSKWMFYVLDEDKRKDFLTYFNKLKKDQEYGLEPIEREQE